MDRLSTALLHLYSWAVAPDRVRDERGDVPGWVMITVMTVAIVGVIWGIAETQLGKMLNEALSSVSKG